MGPSSASSQNEFSFRTRQAEWDRLAQSPEVCLLVVGGGIAGAGILLAAAKMGVPSPLLVEAQDAASGASGASSKLIHAGIRYLEQVWNHLKAGRILEAWRSFRFVVAASRERKRLSSIAPGLVIPIEIHFVVGRDDTRRPLAVAAGVLLYFLIQRFQGQRFRSPRFAFRRAAIARMAPEIDAGRAKAVFTFWDATTDDARLVIETLQTAHRAGARVLTYTAVERLVRDADRWRVSLKNARTGETAEIPADAVVNASGAWVDDVKAMAEPAASRKLVDLVGGGHIDIFPPFTERSFYITAADGRLVFVLARDEDGVRYNRVGTTEWAVDVPPPPGGVRPLAVDEAYLLRAVRAYFPLVTIASDQIVRRDAGIRPLVRQTADTAFAKSREHRIVLRSGLFHVVGVKLTDFRRVAEEWAALYGQWKGTRPSADLDWALRTAGERGFYIEGSPEEAALQTMVVTWEDYFKRRRGVVPWIWARRDPMKLRAEFDQLAAVMGWDESEFRTW